MGWNIPSWRQSQSASHSSHHTSQIPTHSPNLEHQSGLQRPRGQRPLPPDHIDKRQGEECFLSEDSVSQSPEILKFTHRISSFDLSACCQQLRDHSHSTVSTSIVKRSLSILTHNEMNSTRTDSSPPSELQLKPQQTREQSQPPHDLLSKHRGGE
jgi:hypothetical protein